MFNLTLLSGAGKGAVSNWTPALLPNLLAWYSADVGVYTDLGVTLATNTQTVEQWNDRSGNGYNLIQATSGLRPAFQSGGLNSHPTVKFTAASHTALRTAVGVAMGTGTASSGFLMGQMLTASQTFASAICYEPPTASNSASAGASSWVLRNSTTNFIYMQKGAQASGLTNSLSLATTYRMGGVADGTNVTSYLNTVGSSAAHTDTSISGGYIAVGVQLGSSGALGTINCWEGPISEIVITKDAMTAGNISLLDAYLVSRWS